MRLKEVMSYQEKELERKLDEIRAKFTHPGIEGTNFETAFRELLN